MKAPLMGTKGYPSRLTGISGWLFAWRSLSGENGTEKWYDPHFAQNVSFG
jgi:hypothetical protein